MGRDPVSFPPADDGVAPTARADHHGVRLGLIVAAGGHGRRLGACGPKQYVPLLGVPMVRHTIEVLDACSAVSSLVVVVNPEDVAYCTEEIVADRFTKVVAVVGGGTERSLSVRNGLAALANVGGFDLVGVHDGARPLITCGEVMRLCERLSAERSLAGAIIGVPSVDTLKRVDELGVVVETPERGRFWRALTPQVFRWESFVEAYGQSAEILAAATDDSSLVEAVGGKVAVVEGSPDNLKVTTAADLRVAEQMLAERRP